MQIILGIDPGSRVTGYGVVKIHGNDCLHITHGTIQTGTAEVSDKLQLIFATLSDVMEQFQPNQAAIEQVFMHQNAQAALKLGQARGAAMVAAAHFGITVAEYSAKQVKQAVVGYGAAAKQQVQHMICLLLNLATTPAEDAADALAVAICHGRRHAMQQKIQASLAKGR